MSIGNIMMADLDMNRGPMLAQNNRIGLRIWQRILISASLMVGLAALGVCCWIFGMLMFTFALDGANSQQLPNWLEGFMLVGWPISIVVAVVAGPSLVAIGAKWWQAMICLVASTLFSAGVYLVGVVALMNSLYVN